MSGLMEWLGGLDPSQATVSIVADVIPDGYVATGPAPAPGETREIDKAPPTQASLPESLAWQERLF